MDYETHIRLLFRQVQIQSEVQDKMLADIEALALKLDRLTEATDALRHRNEYGLTESEARTAHSLMYLARGQQAPEWQAWPLCHCQIDEGSGDARSLYMRPTPSLEDVYEADR